MPPTPSRDAIVIVLDVGKSVSHLHYWEEKTFFELAKDCVSRIIQRRIISESKDVLSIILIGSEDSDNPLVGSDYKNISCKFDFQLSSWDMLKFVENEIKATDIESDWMGGLIVSMEMLKVYDEFNVTQNKRIVMFSDFILPASDDIDIIIKSIKALKIQITIIGPDVVSYLAECEYEDEPSVKKRRKDNADTMGQGEKLVYEMWKKAPNHITVSSFESALKELCSYVRKSHRVSSWNCILDIGDVKINISMLKKTDPKPAKKFDTRCMKPAEKGSEPGPSNQTSSGIEYSSVTIDRVMHYKHETGIGNEFLDVEVKPEDTIEGYRYGTTIIPFSEDDKTVLDFKSGPKCFSVIGFTHISSVPYYLLSGECSYIVVPRDKDENAETALSAIIQGMKKMECLAIVRKVHTDNSRLALGILYPVIEEVTCDETGQVSHKEFLLFVELAFQEEVKSIQFPSLEHVAKEITEHQIKAVDDLIDGMNLMRAEKGSNGELCEAFESSSLHDTKEQFYHHCVIQRGLHPEKPLPTSLPPYIEEFTKMPKLLEEKSLPLIEAIKEQFKIELNKTTEREDRGRKTEKTDLREAVRQENKKETGSTLEHFSESVIKEEINPVKSSWMELFGKDFPTDRDLDQFFKSHSEADENQKSEIIKFFHEVVRKVREMHVKISPDTFNWWMTRFKSYAVENNGMAIELWGVVVSENIGLISKKENQYSNVSEEEAEEFLCEDVTGSASCCTPKDTKPDFGPLPEVLSELEAEMMAIDSLY